MYIECTYVRTPSLLPYSTRCVSVAVIHVVVVPLSEEHEECWLGRMLLASL